MFSRSSASHHFRAPSTSVCACQLALYSYNSIALMRSRSLGIATLNRAMVRSAFRTKFIAGVGIDICEVERVRGFGLDSTLCFIRAPRPLPSTTQQVHPC